MGRMLMASDGKTHPRYKNAIPTWKNMASYWLSRNSTRLIISKSNLYVVKSCKTFVFCEVDPPQIQVLSTLTHQGTVFSLSPSWESKSVNFRPSWQGSIRFRSESNAAALWYPIRYPIRYPLLPLLLSQVQQHLLLQVILSVVDGNGIVVTSACSISLGWPEAICMAARDLNVPGYPATTWLQNTTNKVWNTEKMCFFVSCFILYHLF